VKSFIENLYEWSKDRKLVTPELHKPNDFYGHAVLLKKYAGIPSNYQIKAAIEHGPFQPGNAWDIDLKSPLPAMLVYGAHRYPILKEKTNKALFSIGPIIRYAPHFSDNHALSMEKQRIGKTLLVFPHHSTHWVDIDYNINRYCRILENIGKEFNTVMVCLYWKDVLRGTAKKYMEHGFECVTAGHMYDPLFLPRLKSIIELATISTSCSYGTTICCCLAMGKPHFVIENKAKRTAASDEILRRDVSPQAEETLIRASQMRDAFSEIRSDISQKQNELANKYFGFSEFKTSAEMQFILQTTEDMYRKEGLKEKLKFSPDNKLADTMLQNLKSSDKTSNVSTYHENKSEHIISSSHNKKNYVKELIKQGIKEVESGKIENAYQTLSKAKACKIPVQNLDHLRALCLLELNKPEDAKKALKAELHYFPDNPEAASLLKEILAQSPQRISYETNKTIEDTQHLATLENNNMSKLHNRQVESLHKQDNTIRTSKAFHKTLKLNSESPNAHNNPGTICLKNDSPTKAIEDFNAALDLNLTDKDITQNNKATPFAPQYQKKSANTQLSITTNNSAISNCKKVFLKPDFVKWIGIRHLDPIGKVFIYNNCYYRAIYHKSSDYVMSLFGSGVIESLINRKLLVQSTLCENLEMEGYAFVIKHAPRNTAPPFKRWPLEMWRDAALIWVETNMTLLKLRLGLIDGHSGNFIQNHNTSPVWCDLGSIQPLKKDQMGIVEFLEYQYYPLMLAQKLNGDKAVEVAREITRIPIDAVKGLDLPPLPSGMQRAQALEHIHHQIQNITFSLPSTTWSDYSISEYNGKKLPLSHTLDPQKVHIRNPLIYEQLKRFNPKKLIDLGANSGRFTFMAKSLIPEICSITAFDYDETALNRLYLHAKTNHYENIIVAQHNCVRKHNYAGDVVMALALTHHLYLGQHFPFDFIAKHFSTYTTNALITEFMPRGLSTGKQPTPNLPAQYTLDNFVAALKNYFNSVEVFEYKVPYGTSPRTLVVCYDKKYAAETL